ncbi:MAG: insulinase family protein [Anaerolineae bacterium]
MKHGFELIREQTIPEINAHVKLFRHVKTGAELLSLENDDENKVFGITFRTPPPDSTGLPHILEHSVLCGSRKYPVKEPFVELLKGSLNTFINAFTFPDKTSYPVASQNVKDLYNLIGVYLDAVFYPRITPHIFRQEGWHYELEALEDPMAFKGVVFNEMKGAYSSPDSVLGRASQQSLFPDIPYGLDSGGDPGQIPNLTYEQFKAFHTTYYHPSNARIFFYGDDDPEERLHLMQTCLKDFEPMTVDSDVPLQARFEQPQRVTVPYDAGEGSPEAKRGMFTINWLLTENDDPQTTLGLNILEHILIGTPASPLRKALIDSGLGEDLAGRGLDNDVRQMYFSTGLKGIAVEDVDQAEDLVLQTLASLVEDGIDPDMVEASLNTIEFSLRENNTGSFPRGVSLMIRSLSTWLYGGDPLAPLAFETPLQAIKGRLASGKPYFENLLRSYLLGNTHRTIVLLRPDPNVRQQQEAVEQERLVQARAAMGEEELKTIIADTRELKRIQETPDSPQALATIPRLTLADLDKRNKLIPLEVVEEGQTKILHHDLFTNGIVYLDVGFDLHTLPQDLLPYVPLFGQALVKIGTETEDFVKLSQRIGRKTGGIWPTTFTSVVRGSASVKGSKATSPSAARLFMRGKATVAQADDLLAILRDVLLTVKLDNAARFQQIVLEAKARKEASLVPGGHGVVRTRLSARFDEAGWSAEQMGGVDYLFFLRQLAEDVEKDWPPVLEKLQQVRRTLLNRNALICNVTLDEANWTQFQPKLSNFISNLPAAPSNTVRWSPPSLSAFEGLTIPARVNYVAKGANLYELGYQLHGSVSVITNYLRTTWLWERVRVQGGAYGGFCLFDQRSGVLSYLSYRDPNLLGTLDNYDQTSQFLQQLELSEDELTKSIIGAIGRIDAYQLPDAKGYTSMTRYLVDESDESRQHIRDQVLSTTASDFKAFANVLQQLNEQGSVVVLGSQEAIDEANVARKDWLDVIKVL